MNHFLFYFLLFILYFLWIRKKGLLNRPVWELIIFVLFFISAFFSQWQNMLHSFDKLIILMGYENYIDAAENLELNNTIGITRILMFITNSIIIIYSKRMKEYFKSDKFNILYDLFYIGTCLSYLFLGSMMFQRILIYFSSTQFIVLAYCLMYLHDTYRQSWKRTVAYGLTVLTVLTMYASVIYRCQDTTVAYISYFQKDMHQVKDELRDKMMLNRF